MTTSPQHDDNPGALDVPAPEDPARDEHYHQFVEALLDIAHMFEHHPDLPLPRQITMHTHPRGDARDRLAAVNMTATILGEPVQHWLVDGRRVHVQTGHRRKHGDVEIEYYAATSIYPSELPERPACPTCGLPSDHTHPE